MLEIADEQYKIRTVVGIVRLPVAAVERVEEAQTPFEEYEQRVRQVADTPEDQTALAVWCRDQGLRAEARRHFQRAIELHPDYEPAHQGLGHVRVGDMWVDGRTVVKRRVETRAADQPKEEDAERLARAIQGQWYRHIRAVKRSLLDSSRETLVKKGRERLLKIKDPLAILPLAQVLSRGDVDQRMLLVEALSVFPEDEATMNLAMIALVDAEEQIRRRALSQLIRRQDPRVIAQYREALRVGNAVIQSRAAYNLGELKASEAIPDLMDVLTVEETKWVQVPVRTYFRLWPRVFSRSTVLTIGKRPAAIHQPEIGVWSLANDVRNEWRYRPVTVYRTEVLEALRRITGQNFGFDRADWQQWYEEHKQ
ncbi:MAG: HEAT repeat domain-containing protein [Phycisphaerae bacterium]|nr:HEAT repeat domain-containing protein [Phycisphaerae bacterium]